MVKLHVPTPETYARYKAEGRCANCGKVGNGSPNCADCRAERNQRFRKKADCTDCGNAIPLKPGKRPRKRCDSCRAHINRERYRNLPPERKAQRRLQLSEYARQWRDTHRKRTLDNQLRRKYGITLEQYVVVFERQGGRCAICGFTLAAIDAPGSERRQTCVDHCHGNGLFRGILCTSCNIAIGLLNDSPDRLRAAAAYVESCPLAFSNPAP